VGSGHAHSLVGADRIRDAVFAQSDDIDAAATASSMGDGMVALISASR
jgi:hypothetical protein